MSQVQVRANLVASDFVFVSKWQGRTVLIGQYDQKSGAESSGAVTGKDNESQPECYYMENVLPTMNGYKSVAFKNIIAPAPAGEVFDRILAFRDNDAPPEQDRGYIGITVSGKTYMISTLNGFWIDITPAGQKVTTVWGDKTEVTVATVLGVTYICYSAFGVFSINMHTLTMTQVTILGISTIFIKGITASNNYMLIHDGAKVYWSNATNPLDFVPSLITGAGSGTPASTGGPIVAMYPLSIGFAVYTTTNIILSSYSGNTRFPWIFKEATNSSGIENVTAVCPTGDEGTNYAWTSSGLLKVSMVGCTPVLPDLTDFLAGNILEAFNPVTNTFSLQYLTAAMYVTVNYSTSRYIMVSYGPTRDNLVACICYDLTLKRVGKLNLPHIAAFDFVMDYKGVNPTYIQLGYPYNTTYTGYGNATYQQLAALSAVPSKAKHTMALMQANGAIQLVIEDYGDFTANAVLLLGKYQMLRNNAITLQGIDIEHIDSANLTLHDIYTYDGSVIEPAKQLVTTKYPGKITAAVRITAVHHSILLKGSFNLVSLLFSFCKHGRV
jgi:hypothetical protein